jgi:hypothetical protein
LKKEKEKENKEENSIVMGIGWCQYKMFLVLKFGYLWIPQVPRMSPPELANTLVFKDGIHVYPT